MAALTFVVLNQVWPNGLGLFAGAGIILIGRAAGGILGLEVSSSASPGSSRRPAGDAAPGSRHRPVPGWTGLVVGGGTRAAG